MKEYMKVLAITHFILLARFLSGLLHVFSVSADETTCTFEGKAIGGCNNNALKDWADDIGDKVQNFLQDKIFGQDLIQTSDHGDFLSLLDGNDSTLSGHNEKKGNPFLDIFDRLAERETQRPKTPNIKNTHSDDIVDSMLQRVQELNEKDASIIGEDFFKLIMKTLEKAMDQLRTTFGQVFDNVDGSIAIAMAYFIAQEDAKKNPSWKRRQHRFHKPVTKQMVMELHDALYVSALSYVNSVEDFRKGLVGFRNNEWEMAYGTTDSLPNLPAHFFLVHKHVAPLVDPRTVSVFPWAAMNDSKITVAIVVRGTKHPTDVLADALLEAIPYRDGYAHGGILENGKNLAAKYLPKLKDLLVHSGRDRIKVYLIGHSLGAGAASIAAMQLKEHNWIEVEALGFGCPSLLSQGLSESTTDYITTIVSDADIVPRMSGSSMINLLLDLIEFDWTNVALDDLEYTVEKARQTFVLGNMLPPTATILDWVKDRLDEDIRPNFSREKSARVPSLLIPPGNCIHFFRDGVGYTGSFTPCSFFSSVDLVRTLIDDHLILPGYHRALLTIVRDWDNNFDFQFPHNIAAIKT